MEHTFYSDGDSKRISWLLKDDQKSMQWRDHADIYLDKVTSEQSKYIALHVGIFWCIGTFRIKNHDTVNVMIDLKTMFEHLTGKSATDDDFIRTRTGFINQLIQQRGLEIKYHLISKEDNLASKLLTAQG